MQTFVINLDRSKIRLSDMKRRLDQIGLSFERIPAIEGRNLSETEKSGFVDKALNKKFGLNPLTSAEIGCFLSHRIAWQRIIDLNLPYGLILEDDLNFHPEICNFLEALENFILDQNAVDLSAVRLSGKRNKTLKNTLNLPNTDFKLGQFVMPPNCGQAVVVTQKGAALMLEETKQFFLPLDNYYSDWWHSKANILYSDIRLTLPNQHASNSTIQNQNLKPMWTQLKREARRLIWRFQRNRLAKKHWAKR